MRAHLDTEAYLQELSRTHAPDFTYTVLREGIYHDSFPIYTSFFNPWKTIEDEANKDAEIEIKIPHDGSAPGVAWANREELAEASAKIIVQYARNPHGFPFTNSTLLLSGPKVLSLGETMSVLGKLIGRRIRIKEVSVDEYARQPHVAPLLTYHGVDLSREWASAWQAIRNGECAVVTPVLKEIFGREPENFETALKKTHAMTIKGIV